MGEISDKLRRDLETFEDQYASLSEITADPDVPVGSPTPLDCLEGEVLEWGLFSDPEAGAVAVVKAGPEGAKVTPHSHPVNEFYFCGRGSVRTLFPRLGEEHEITAGDEVLKIPADEVHLAILEPGTILFAMNAPPAPGMPGGFQLEGFDAT